MIRTAEEKDLQKIKNLTEACASAMQNKNIFQWNEHYPSLERLALDIQKQELYVKETNAEIEGIIVLTSFMDDEYLPVKWLTKSVNNLYIHRLATNPEKWGSGTGKELMDFAEGFAREHNFESVRLDTFSQNKRNQKFYEARGYKKLEDIYFPKQSRHPFHCYELLL
ncbi:GNAT family N-acetyltransferase [Zunongwangia sp. F363]|uniref:GNAT family N-acetyltransferase n=1 Tax=Autumnicola tepida TaxID=3075595 RepID=A0ABU3CB99_9FLAO|nr:GNAT family N-acetyltransferase [Zunongwangia sp. F363]MDT0643605.1 GNAT family N-acetyltransferase [Zunongwangia sp. F363]